VIGWPFAAQAEVPAGYAPAVENPSRSKFAGMIKHPVWVTVGTVVGVVGLVVTYFQMNDSASPEDLQIANVSFSSPAPIEAIQGREEEGEGGFGPNVPAEEPATPIDITLKNNGGTPAHIVRLEAEVLEARSATCSQRGGGTQISAFYSVKVPYDPWKGEAKSKTVTSPIDFTVKPNSVDRMVITVGPEWTGNKGDPILMAVRIRLVPERGEPLLLDPIAVSQPYSVDSQIEYNKGFVGLGILDDCFRREADELSSTIQSTKLCSPDVIRLRDGYAASV
jgi:hypothetical protein